MTVAHERPICSILAGDIVPTHPMCAPSQQAQILHSSMCDDSTVAVLSSLTCLPILPFISPPGSSVVTSPRAPRQFLECLGMFSWGPSWPFFQNRPARTPPSPPPMSLSPFHLQASPIHAGLFFSSVHLLPCPHATSHCVFPQSHPSRSQLSSSSAQLGSHSHISSMFLLWAARHGRTGRIYS